MVVKIMNGNIADMCADAIVLPANEMLKEGRGCSRALFERAGRRNLEQACGRFIAQVGRLSIGDVAVTPAYHLQAQCILHAVVPKWIDGNSEEYVNLMMTYMNALNQADTIGCTSVAFPLLASGNNGYDLGVAFNIAMEAISTYEAQKNLSTVFLVIYGDRIVNMVRNCGYQVFRVRKLVSNRSSYRKEKSAADVAWEIVDTGLQWIKQIDREHPEIRQLLDRKIAELIIKRIG